jgi:hypothetical protein
MTTFEDRLYQMDGVPVGPASILGMTPGKVFFLDPANGSDDNLGTSPNSAFKTMAVAYAALTDGANDVLYLIGNGTGLTLPTALTWAKSYTHLVGLCAPTMVAKRARIFQLSTLTAASPFITFSGSGCLIKDLYAFQGVNDATSLINVAVTGGRNHFSNVHFAGGGHAAQAIDGGASLKLDGAEENTFDGCVVGVDTISAGTGMVDLLFDSEAHRNIFRNCLFSLYAGHTGAAFVEVADGTGIDRYNLFDNCNFINSNSDNFLMASGFVIPAFAANNSSRLLLKNCMVHGTTKLDANDRGVLYGDMGAVTGADLSGVAVELIS